ncbi:hypothetical protein CTAYLR_008974 [Chrysophaeum taylorii]|uniref:Uncharacterized protein n=1 Tax=Chrysophaeum taylorii TaxID=2483200 RepID=A0AAD7UJV9_9STRA|nr:hypothetical protein CTAYLR_008974 [Chrysophaeum taylorii]
MDNIYLCVLGLFAFYVLHDALQERAFRTEGFRFGWWMTLNELVVVSLLAFVFEWAPAPVLKENQAVYAQQVRRLIVFLAFALTVSQGAGSASLAFVNFPLKVAFKSSKLLPTMIFGVLLTGKRYGGLDYLAAALLAIGLAGLSFADARSAGDPKLLHDLAFGCFLLALAVCSDALVPNLQERLLKQLQYPVGRMVVASNVASVIFVFIYIVLTGELGAAVEWTADHPAGAAFILLQALSSYAGLRCYLKVVKNLSGVAGVVVTTFRKVLTIILSFLAFAKPFSLAHLHAFAFLGLGIAVATYSKYHRPRVEPQKPSPDLASPPPAPTPTSSTTTC